MKKAGGKQKKPQTVGDKAEVLEKDAMAMKDSQTSAEGKAEEEVGGGDPEVEKLSEGQEGEAEEEGEEEVTVPVTATSQVWVKTRQYVRTPRRQDFLLKSEELRCIEDGEILVKALCWTVEHYMRIFDIPLGSTMIGEQVANVVDSRHPDFPVTSLVVVPTGWRTFSIVNPGVTLVREVPDLAGLPVSLCLGTLGLPGLTAYFGLLDICQAMNGDVVLVNAAAGCVGSLVGQLAKLQNCSVIGFAGSKARCDWMRELGFDHVFNYNAVNPGAAVRRAAPNGVDCYFDNVGAGFTEDVLGCVKPMGRVCVCGDVATYRQQLPEEYKPDPYRLVSLIKRRVSTHTVFDFAHRFAEAEARLLDWVHQGKLRYQHTEYSGFRQLPEALAALYDGEKAGKLVVTSDDDQPPLLKADDVIE